MEFLQQYGKEIVALLVPVITFGLNRVFHRRAKLILGEPHTFRFLIPEPLRDANGTVVKPNQTVQTRSYVLQNSGKEPAENIEWVFNWKPHCINWWPVRQYEEREIADKRYAIVFRSLAPGEWLQCETFSVNADVPDVITVRSNQCVAERIQVRPQRVYSRWQIGILRVLLFIGLAATVYLAILLLQFLIVGTPISTLGR